MVYKLVRLAIIIVVVGCSTTNSKAEETVRIVTGYDQYEKATVITTEKFSIPDVGSFYNQGFAFAWLRGVVRDQGDAFSQMRIYYSGQNWKFFSSAIDIDSNRLPVGVVARHVDALGVSEELAIPMPKDYLQAHRDTGFNFRVDGKSGSIIIKLPTIYIRTFMSSMDEAHRAALTHNAEKLLQASPNTVKFGVSYLPVNAKIAELTKLPEPNGVIVASVVPGSSAEKAGIKMNDVLIAINGVPIPATQTGLQEVMVPIKAGDSVNCLVWRNGQKQVLRIQF